jgi:hypothetical protein
MKSAYVTIITWIVIAAMLILLPVGAALAVNGEYGASAVRDGRTYSLEETLTYAIQDEYLAYARYRAFIERFGEQRPFTNIVEAENMHIMLLKSLLGKYGLPVPNDESGEFVTVPGTLEEAVKAAAEAEKAGIRMYDTFLKQDLPSDVSAVYGVLSNANQNHVRALERRAARLGGGLPDGTGISGAR